MSDADWLPRSGAPMRAVPLVQQVAEQVAQTAQPVPDPSLKWEWPEAEAPATSALPDLERAPLLALTQAEEAQIYLLGETEDRLDLPWSPLAELVGPMLRGETWVLGARPNNGKTTFLLNLLDAVVGKGQRVLYVGMEMPPWRLRVLWACWRLGLDSRLVLRKQWASLPKGGRDALVHMLDEMAETLGDKVLFLPDERVTLRRMLAALQEAAIEGYDVVMCDYFQRIDFGHGAQRTQAISEAIIAMASLVRAESLRLLLAAQLGRPEEKSVVGDYQVQPAAALAECGRIEQEADVVLTLNRGLRRGVTHGELAAVTRGTASMRDLADPGCMNIHVAKHRSDGDARSRDVRLYVHRGRMYPCVEDMVRVQQAEFEARRAGR